MATAANTVHKLQKTQYVGANNTMVHNSDVVVRGNLTIVGTQAYAQTQTLLVRDNIITLNAAINQSGVPLFDAGIEIDRGSEQNVSFLWVESEGTWKFTNDGVNFEALGGGSAGSYANSAFDKANSAFNAANNASDSWVRNQANLAFTQANSAFDAANNATDTYVRNHANLAFDTANAAYDFANSSSAWSVRQTYTTTAGQNTFVVGTGYLPNYVDVFYNGLKLVINDDYYANDGVNIFFTQPTTVNSTVEVISFGANVAAANLYVFGSTIGFAERQSFFATEGQTTFVPTGGYRVGYIDVFYNGLKMNIPNDVTANDGINVVFVGLTPTVDDVIETVATTPQVGIANAVPISGGTISGNLDVAGNILPTSTNTYYLGSDSNRWHSLFVGPGSIDLGGLVLSNVNGTLAVAAAGQPPTPLAGEDSWVRDQANAAFLQANSAFSSANNVDLTPAFNQANAAFEQANTVQFAFIQANAAFSVANTADSAPAFNKANSAFDAANTKLSTSKSIALSIVLGG